ncbi:MAG: AAA family ATPase [Candidatus Omnitrophica bacterium]|nr:AAA family ATPase [Candidatus Omnitrophota bacterium]MBU4589574.1 AAA family ATPase [Candidatus Omnitrophota bacterium]
MSYIIAVAGKGGVGKTTVSALLIQELLRIEKPVLAIDADPNSNLNVLMGFEYKSTISDIREEAKNLTSPAFSKSDFFNMRLQEIVEEGDGIDLLVMGRPEGPGCYCAVNNILRDYLGRLAKNYRFVVIDNEAGMEHLSRRTADSIDKLLLVSDPTAVGIQSAIHAFRAAKDAGVKIKGASLIINKSKGVLGNDKIKAIKESGLDISGYILFQEEIEKNSEKGNKLSTVSRLSLEHLVQGLALNT